MSQKPEITTRVYKPIQVVPYIKSHKLGKLEKECVTVKLNSREWVYCDTASKDMWANSKSGNYGKGILNTSADPAKTERTGLLGEMAFAKIADMSVDFSYSEGGKEHDFEGPYGSIDIKTASKLQTYKSMLVYAKSGSGKEIPLTSSFYVGAFVSHESIEEQKATVVIVGWCTNETIQAKPLVQGKSGFWYNKEVPYKELRNITELLEIINSDAVVSITPKEDENDNKDSKKKLSRKKRISSTTD